MYPRFGLVLMVTHACNLRCTYCYAGAKSSRTMDAGLGRKAIDRAVASIEPGGTLELGFFGGEPLLEAELVGGLIDYAHKRLSSAGVGLHLSITTNGTITDPAAWAIMLRREVELALSHDGLPEVHDRHRRYADGRDSSEIVVKTMRQLVEGGREFRVIVVVRPDTLESLPEGVRFLQSLGVRRIEPALDLWARWSTGDEARLEQVIEQCAEIWRDGLPHHCLGWFDEKVAHLAHIPIEPTARCGFGDGEVAVAPSGRLYPCERLIGEDRENNPMALPGNAADGLDFLDLPHAAKRSEEACGGCEMATMCNTFCRCGNYVRTGDVSRPDGLLCRWNQACLLQTAKVLEQLAPKERYNG